MLGVPADHPIIAQRETSGESLEQTLDAEPDGYRSPHAPDHQAHDEEGSYRSPPTLQDTVDELNNTVRRYREDGILSNEEAREGTCAALYVNAHPGVGLSLENQAREIYDVLDRQMAYGDSKESVECLEYLADLVRSDGVLDNREAAFVATVGAQIAQQYSHLADELRESTRELYGVD